METLKNNCTSSFTKLNLTGQLGEQGLRLMVRAKREDTSVNDEWVAKLFDGREIQYKRKTLLSGRIKISAQAVDADTDLSRIVDFPVERRDVEIVFLRDLV